MRPLGCRILPWALAGVGALLLALPPSPAGVTVLAGAAPTLEEIVDGVQATCSRTQDLSARFHQTVSYRSLGQVREGRGSFLLKRPAKVRWEYQQPEPRLILTDGTTLWDYSPVDKQVRVQEFGVNIASRLPMSFLAGDCQLRREFSIARLEHAGTRAVPHTAILDLTPLRGEAGVTRILLEVDLRSYTVEKTTVFDAAGNTNVLAFANLKLNQGLGDEQFRFAPPAGVTVVTPPRP
jgi:outer membrane lipoprotein carrier protein